MNQADQIREQIAQLQAALIKANLGMPTMLRTIHKALQEDKDIVTVMSPEEVGILVSGLLKHTNTVIATAAAKTTTKKLKNISLDML